MAAQMRRSCSCYGCRIGAEGEAQLRFWLLASLAAMGCVTSASSQQVALVPLPGASPAVRGSAGLGLAARIAVLEPSSTGIGDAVATPRFQPELSNVFRIAEHWSITADIWI